MHSRLTIVAVLMFSFASTGATQATSANSTNVHVTFVAKADSFSNAVRDYEQIWAADGARMIATMERMSGLSFRYKEFQDTAITATVLEAASNSGYRSASGMTLRASYPSDTKRATLVHELGHRLMAGLYTRDEQEHGPLFLWLYETWVALYGQRFADEQVAVERGRGGVYPAQWDYALKMSPAERATAWKKILAERLPTRLR